jgi:hypothetical protein
MLVFIFFKKKDRTRQEVTVHGKVRPSRAHRVVVLPERHVAGGAVAKEHRVHGVCERVSPERVRVERHRGVVLN